MPAGVLIDRTTTPAVEGTPSVYGHGMGTGPGEEAAPPPSPTGTALVAQMANGLESVKLQGVAAAMGAGPESSSSSPLLGRCGTAALPGQVPPSSSLVAAGRKSMNMTECVHVASSEHVAEIVGRQGSKIKALRAKTNTYIKTPVRGEEPVFVVTGRKEDVAAAKKEILAIAEHFSQIRAGRLGNNVGGRAPSSLGFLSADIPGHVTIHVRVPYRVVGLVVGPKGATIKRIQQDSQTYIITPSRDREPIFEVSGLSENVEKARREIESYIALRTGTGVSDAAIKCGGNTPLAIPRSFSCELEMTERDTDSQTLLGSMFKPQLSGTLASSALASLNNSLNLGMVNKSNALHSSGIDSCGGPSHGLLTANKKNGSLPQGCIYGPKVLTDYAAYSSGKTAERPTLPYPNGNLLTNEFWSQINNVEAPWLLDGLSAYFPSAENISVLQNEALTDACNAPTALDSLNFAASRKLYGNNGADVDRNGKDGIARLSVNGGGPSYVGKVHSGSLGSESNSPSISPTDSVGSPSQGRRRCFVCGDNTIVAALVPCGHNLFCMDCAQAVLDRKDQLENRCPVCQQMASLAVRILS